MAFNDLHIVVAIAAGQSGDMRDGVEASMQVGYPQIPKSMPAISEACNAKVDLDHRKAEQWITLRPSSNWKLMLHRRRSLS
jgi:hypothetical protein